MSDLIDTTEMYLRTIFELEEEGVVPLRARIAERLEQSGPTVSQTVARMERDGLVTVEGDRHLELTDEGRALATRVMRKHRLAERLLGRRDRPGVGARPRRGVPLGARDERGGRAAARRAAGPPDRRRRTATRSPGWPSSAQLPSVDSDETLVSLAVSVTDEPRRLVVRRIGEPVQVDAGLMAALHRAGVRPGEVVKATTSAGGVLVGSGMEYAELDLDTAGYVFVSVATTA